MIFFFGESINLKRWKVDDEGGYEGGCNESQTLNSLTLSGTTNFFIAQCTGIIVVLDLFHSISVLIHFLPLQAGMLTNIVFSVSKYQPSGIKYT
jgi:hypothetical protein